jgi:hypothetical protein
MLLSKLAADETETASGKRQRKAHKQNAVRRAALAALLGGGAYGSYRLGNWFLPEESRKALAATADRYHSLQRSRVLSGPSDALDNKVVGSYAELASRLASSPVAGMQGKDFVKLVRTSLPVGNAWRPFWSDAHYDAFARGPAYGAAQLIDEHASDMSHREGQPKKLLEYLAGKFTGDFGSKVNDIAKSEAGAQMFDPKVGLREGLAYGTDNIHQGAQETILQRILTDKSLDAPNRNWLGLVKEDGLGSATRVVKRDLSDALLNSSFPNYIRLGGYANAVRGTLSGALPALLGIGAVGAAGAGLYSALKSTKRTKEEERRLRDKDKSEDTEKAASISKGMLRSFLNGSVPLFHSMSGANAKGLLKDPRALSAVEAVGRGLADNVELRGHFGRNSVAEYLSDATKPTIRGDKATLSIPDILRAREHADSPRNFWGVAGDLVRADYGGSVGDYAKYNLLQQLKSSVKSTKSWSNISFSEGEPWRNYGEFGIMTTPSRIQGKINLPHVAGAGGELSAGPLFNKGDSGLFESLTLPAAPGKIFYHPSKENAELARKLQTQYGRHNVLPWSSRLQKWLIKQNMTHQPPGNVHDGNLSPEQISARFPDDADNFERAVDTVWGWVNPKSVNKSANMFSPANLLARARRETNTSPTKAQQDAGNYAKGRVKLHGMLIALENPKGSTRSGVSDSGKAWSTKMKADYGYFVGTEAVDGDAVDVFIGPNLDSEFVVAIDQQKGDSFDETKFVIGCTNREQAQDLYLAHYDKGWKLGPVSTASVAQLKRWLKDGDTKKPFAGQMLKSACLLGSLIN